MPFNELVRYNSQVKRVLQSKTDCPSEHTPGLNRLNKKKKLILKNFMASLTFATRHLLLQMCAETNTNRPEHCTLLPPLNLIPIFLARSYLTKTYCLSRTPPQECPNLDQWLAKLNAQSPFKNLQFLYAENHKIAFKARRLIVATILEKNVLLNH